MVVLMLLTAYQYQRIVFPDFCNLYAASGAGWIVCGTSPRLDGICLKIKKVVDIIYEEGM